MFITVHPSLTINLRCGSTDRKVFKITPPLHDMYILKLSCIFKVLHTIQAEFSDCNFSSTNIIMVQKGFMRLVKLIFSAKIIIAYTVKLDKKKVYCLFS